MPGDAGDAAAASLTGGICRGQLARLSYLELYLNEIGPIGAEALLAAGGETVVLLHPPLPLVGISIVMRERASAK